MNEQESVVVCPAGPQDAAQIGKVVVMAIGADLAMEFLARPRSGKTLADVEAFFGHLAALPTSQYSYVNTIKAVDAQGDAMGYLVCYDGGKLEELRRDFFRVAREELSLCLSSGDVADETVPGELYIDSLGVLPAYRGRGVAKALLRAAVEKAGRMGLRAGLLVDKENMTARRLYDSAGFRKVGETPFAGMMMDHLQYGR